MKRAIALALLFASSLAFGDWPSWNNPPGIPTTGATSITTLGTVTSGTWNGTVVTPDFGGTGVANGASSTTTLGGPLVTTGAFTTTFAAGGTATHTLPTTSSTLARTDAAQTFTGHNVFEGVTPTGATGTGNMVFSIAPTFTGTSTVAARKTASGNTGSIATATPTTIFSIAATGGLYTVYAWLASGTGSVYSATSMVADTGDVTTGKITAVTTGSNLTITLTAGGAVQVTQTSGSNQTIQWVYELMAQ